MEKKTSSILWGTLIVIVGMIFLGNNLNWWHFEIFFDGWWTLFIIIPSIVSLVKEQTFFSSTIFILLGILLFLACQEIIEWNLIWQIMFPSFIILLGLSIIFKPKPVKKVSKNTKNQIEYVGVFSGAEERIKDDFEGASCTAVFGGVDLDITDATIKEDIVIDCTSIFGSVTIKVPDNVKVKVIGTPIFGGVENRSKQNKTSQTTIYVNYVCIFGGIEVR